ncbi:MAG: 23S rRNA (uracil(1939)-C(5))-methyltransferase RlmD [Candidatus Accumulibacter sp.]|jgi:23S rRNA (uracil1939-C5)-methyltransferase|nr:23S rRNA (uracil(1939)-C(5))-methyltransferase RlmD [Accumulibacter sp.]
MPTGIIESLDHEARGITRLAGKTVFVEGALPDERVEYSCHRKKPTYEIARVDRIVEASASRVEPKCPHFGICGGCSLQHLEPSAQVAVKQRLLESSLWHLGRLAADRIYAPIHGSPWAYRFRARLSARLVPKKGGMLIGFHERRSSYVADMRQCPILPGRVSDLLLPLRELAAALSIRSAMPQIELAVGAAMTALVLRILEPLDANDQGLLRDFADRHDIVFYLQPGGPASVYRFYPLDERRLSYFLPDYGIEHDFSPTEFTQVNHAINRMLVRRAMGLLEVRKGERIADLFCGLGNFTLPIARAGAQAIGIEGNVGLVRRARDNAAANGLGDRVDYRAANLFETTPETFAALGRFDKMLIDPPREGAAELVKAIGADGPRRIVYVSCNPATLARDAAILVHQKGYGLAGAGVVNMFPNTSHVESIALFEKICL